MHSSIHPVRLLTRSLVFLFAVLAIPSLTHAALLVYEGFDYGANNLALQNVSGTPTGLAGGGYNNTTGSYLASGLSFGALQVTGGHASVTATNSFRVPSKQFATGTLAGTIYGSYLYQQTAATDNRDVNMVAFGPNGLNDNNNTVAFLTDSYTTAGTDAAASIKSDPNNTGATAYIANGTQPPPAPGGPVTLALFEITHVGAVAGTQQVTLWLLSAAQFDTFKSGAGGLTTAELNGASIGAGADNVQERVTLSIDGSGGYIGLSDGSFLNLGTLLSTVSFDEIRISNLDLNEVTPIPEPTAVMLLGLAGILLVTCRRRERTR